MENVYLIKMKLNIAINGVIPLARLKAMKNKYVFSKCIEDQTDYRERKKKFVDSRGI